MTETTNQTPFKEMWALVELMGHTKVTGRITEETHFGVPLMRCDIPIERSDGTPTGDAYFTQWYGGDAIFRITPIDETTARAFAQGSTPHPIKPYELPATTAGSYIPEYEDDFDDSEF